MGHPDLPEPRLDGLCVNGCGREAVTRDGRLCKGCLISWTYSANGLRPRTGLRDPKLIQDYEELEWWSKVVGGGFHVVTPEEKRPGRWC